MGRQIKQTGIVTERMGSNATGFNHIDAYQTFTQGSDYWLEGELDNIADMTGADPTPFVQEGRDLWHGGLEYHYDHAGWVQALAVESVEVMAELLGEDDPVVKGITFTGESWSPREYNFTTDGYMAEWTIDADALEAWLAENNVVLSDGRGVSGFFGTADDDFWYLATGLRRYLEETLEESDYFYGMTERLNQIEHDYQWVTISDELAAYLIAEGGDPAEVEHFRTRGQHA